MKLQIVKVAICLFLISLAAFAQEILTNADIIALVKAEIGDRVIIAKIETSACRFDTSTTAILKLTEADVSDSVIAAMIAKGAKGKAGLSDIPEQGSLTDLKAARTFYVNTDDVKARERIRKEIEGAKFVMADKAEAADFVVGYRQWEEYVPGSPYMNKIGILDVFTIVNGPDNVARRRSLYTTRKEKFYVFTGEPAQTAAAQFVKDLRKAIK